jgi:ABC-2 type transport system ATP-binding protein
LKLISTILLPDRGDVLVNGGNTREQARQVRAQIGFALASERSFFPRLTVRENLDFFAALENIPRNRRAACVQSAIRDVQLESHAGKQAMKLSSGLQQRLGIARALVKAPRILLLDEPTRSLDPASAEHLWVLIRQLANDGITIVLATHNFAEAISVSDRIAILQTGNLRTIEAACHMSAEELRSRYMEATGSVEISCWPEQIPA